MRVTGLDGRSYSLNLAGREFTSDKNCSQYHERARELLQKLYPLDRILEEVSLPGSDGLVADFVLPTRKLVVEVHGPQHYSFTPFFHKSVIDFWNQRKRDEKKKEWSEINGIEYVELPWDKEEEWEQRIYQNRR